MNCHFGGIGGFGSPNAQVLFVQNAPSKQDLQSEIPLSVGAGAQLFNEIIRAIGINRDDVYVTSLVCTPTFRPEPFQIIGCYSRLEKETKEIQPKLIVTLDEESHQTINPDLDFKSARGAVLWSDRWNCYTLATWHPNAVYRGFVDAIHDILRDMDKIPLILSWPAKVARSEINWAIAQSREEAQSWLDSRAQDELVTIDIETHQGKDNDGNIDVFQDRLLTVCVATVNEALVIPESCAQGLNWPTHIKYGYHNSLFDTQGIRRFLGVQLPIDEDSMFQSHSLDERVIKGLHTLKGLSREYLGVGFYEQELGDNRKKGSMADVPWETLCFYNAKDAVYTARLIEFFKPRQIADGVRWHYENVTIPAARMFAEVQFRGIAIDQNNLLEAGLALFPRYLQLSQELKEMANEASWPGEINLESNQQISKLLYQYMRLPGGPKTDKVTLEALKELSPFVQKLLICRQIFHSITHYHLGVKDRLKLDGRLHSDVMVGWTLTHRLAYHNPSLMNIKKPKSDETESDTPEDRIIRSQFGVTSDEYVFVETDYSQAELYAAAAISHDEQLYEDLCSADFHALAAAAQRQISIEEVTEEIRRDGKVITFGNMFGLGDEKAGKKIGVAPEVAKKFKEGFYTRYKGFKKWRENVRKIGTDEGEIQSPTGWKRRVHLMNVGEKAYHFYNELVNTPIQNTASDTTLMAAIKLHELLKPYDSYVLWLVHDSINLELNKRYLHITLPLIREVMETPQFEGCYSCPVEFKIGDNWGSVVKIKDLDAYVAELRAQVVET